VDNPLLQVFSAPEMTMAAIHSIVKERVARKRAYHQRENHGMV
jgi:hypothetical protein